MTTLSESLQDEILKLLKDNPGFTADELMARTMQSRAWVIMAIKRLQIAGHVARVNGVYTLTESGRNYTALWGNDASN